MINESIYLLYIKKFIYYYFDAATLYRAHQLLIQNITRNQLRCHCQSLSSKKKDS